MRSAHCGAVAVEQRRVRLIGDQVTDIEPDSPGYGFAQGHCSRSPGGLRPGATCSTAAQVQGAGGAAVATGTCASRCWAERHNARSGSSWAAIPPTTGTAARRQRRGHQGGELSGWR